MKFCCSIVRYIDIYVFEVVDYEFCSKITVKLGGGTGGGDEGGILLYNYTIHGYINVLKVVVYEFCTQKIVERRILLEED